jgi:NADPH:quinone reductase-like Zn-dependent oxidoreductase
VSTVNPPQMQLFEVSAPGGPDKFTSARRPLFERGALKPVVNRVLPLAQAAEAHRLMERAGHIGKIVLQA